LADSRCRDWLARAATLAKDRGLQITLEPVHPLLRRWSYVHTLDHADRLVDDIEGAALVVDVGHLWWDHDLEELISKHIQVIATVQLTNIDRAALEEVRYERAPLDAGDVPVARIVRHLEAVGYRGWYENEVLARIPRDKRLETLRASREWIDSLPS
jgi:sugar phosphate isomerase/epimerase